jgi:hypothetical protein
MRRAELWLAAATRFEAWGDFVPPTCRTHYGGILIALGRWEEAERELLAAIRIFETGYWASQLFPLLRLADLRVRQGRLEEAERLLEGIDWHTSAKRSLARIALARGDLALAEDLVGLCLEGVPPSDPDCPLLLGLLVEVQLARGDLDAAEATLDQLAELAGNSDDDRTRAVVTLAHAGCEPLEETSKHGPTSKRPWSRSRGSVFRWKRRRRESRSPARSSRMRRRRQSSRRESRSRRLFVWAPPAMPTRPPPYSESWEHRRGSRRGDSER